MLIAVIVFLVLFFASFFLMLHFLWKQRTEEEDALISKSLSLGVIVGGLFITTISLSFDYSMLKQPQAIDVYRGKTEMIINGEMIDSTFIPKDTLIVFKDKINKL